MLESLLERIGLFTQSVLTSLKILLQSKFFLKFDKALKSNIIILGNGPSLKETLKSNLDILQSNQLLAVNSMASTEIFETIKPSHYLIVSDEYWNPGSIKKHQDIRDNIIKDIIKKTTWPLLFYLPISAKKNSTFISTILSNKNIKINYYNKTPVEGLSTFSRMFMSWGLGMPRPHNVLIPSIYVCVMSQYKNIYLLGADHSWIPQISVDNENNALVNQQHFYDADKDNRDTMHKNSKPRRLHQILEKFMLSFKAYFDLKDYAESKGVNIYNCTPGSFIDAFNREEISSLVVKATKKEIS